MIACVLEQQAARLREWKRWRKGDQRNQEQYYQASTTGTILELQKGPIKQSNRICEMSGQQGGRGKAEGEEECSEMLLWP